jgi:2-polyprenyl-6-methoxyphenol hydroxylase-like FAD-dependent oxidoreductase
MRAMVIGAGIGGLSAGIALNRIGAEVTVYERMTELHEVGSGLTLWTNAIKTLDKLGVGETVRQQGGLVRTLDNRTWDGKELKVLPISEVGERFGAHSYGVHRAELQRLLADVLGQDHLELGAELVGFEEDGEGVTARFADGREDRADVLIGADGIRSTVREKLFGEVTPRYSGYTCWRSAATVDDDVLPPDLYIQVYGSGSNFGIFPIGASRASWYGTRVTPAGGSVGAGGPQWKREALTEFADWYEPVRKVIERTDEAQCVRQDIYDLKPITTWGSKRVTLLGDAAHATTPALGQGGCMAIEDAYVLARTLSQADGDTASALGSYAEQRHGRTNGIVRQARRHGVLYHGTNRVAAGFRDFFFRHAPLSVPMKTFEKLLGYEA